MTLVAQIDTALKAFDHASVQGGAWFLIAAVFTMGLAIAWMARAFQQRHDRVCARLDEVQNQHVAYLEKSNAELIRALDHNSSAMLEFSHSLASIHRLLEGRPVHHPNLP